MEHTESTEGWAITPVQANAELERQRKEVLEELQAVPESEVVQLQAEVARLRAALEKIADWHGHWGPFPEKREDWRSMAIVTAREAVPQSRPGQVIHTFSTTKCGCLKCIQTRGDKSPSGLPLEATMMIVCPKCGDKRCPHAEDHSKECTK